MDIINKLLVYSCNVVTYSCYDLYDEDNCINNISTVYKDWIYNNLLDNKYINKSTGDYSIDYLFSMWSYYTSEYYDFNCTDIPNNNDTKHRIAEIVMFCILCDIILGFTIYTAVYLFDRFKCVSNTICSKSTRDDTTDLSDDNIKRKKDELLENTLSV